MHTHFPVTSEGAQYKQRNMVCVSQDGVDRVKDPVNANSATCNYSLKQKPKRKFGMISTHPCSISKLDAPISNKPYAV